MTDTPPAFYALTGGRGGDFLTLLHLPYTAWHLSYVAMGAALAPALDGRRLVGTLLAFALGLGVGAHALDELHDRPLATGFSDGVLRALGLAGLAGGGLIGVVAAFVISPWALAWAAVGVALASAYALEWSQLIHSTVGFGLAWGAFPVLVGFWAQTETITAPVLALAAAATLFSMTQRALSTPARHIRRKVDRASAQIGEATWEKSDLLVTWERPLRLLALAHVTTAVALLLAHLHL